jgi:hypothetical protein
MKLVYLAHPLSGDIAANLARAKRWLRWVLDLELPIAPIAPWIDIVEAWEQADAGKEDGYLRWRGLEMDLAVVERCDEIWLVGGTISTGMALERERALKHHLRVNDLTFLGPEPPEVGTAADTIAQKALAAWTRP